MAHKHNAATSLPVYELMENGQIVPVFELDENGDSAQVFQDIDEYQEVECEIDDEIEFVDVDGYINDDLDEEEKRENQRIQDESLLMMGAFACVAIGMEDSYSEVYPFDGF